MGNRGEPLKTGGTDAGAGAGTGVGANSGTGGTEPGSTVDGDGSLG